MHAMLRRGISWAGFRCFFARCCFDLGVVDFVRICISSLLLFNRFFGLWGGLVRVFTG